MSLRHCTETVGKADGTRAEFLLLLRDQLSGGAEEQLPAAGGGPAVWSCWLMPGGACAHLWGQTRQH